jgi:opacity protein-like surface antigen
LRFVFFLAAGLLLANFKGRAAEPGPFFSVSAGGNIMNDFDLGSGASLEMDPGSRFDGSVGYSFYVSEVVSISAAFETGILYNSIKNGVNAAGAKVPIDGELWQSPALARFGFKFMPDSQFNPFVGIAGGGVYSEMEIRRVGTTPVFSVGDQWDPGAQATVGFKFRFADNMAIGLSYKCLVAFPDGFDEVVNHGILAAFAMQF